MIEIRAESLQKSYKGRCVVKDASISVKQGEVIGLLGPNGAGKTTTFYMIVGLVKPDSGKITLGDEDITSLPMHLRATRGVGYLPQEASVFRKLSVEDNIMSVLEIRKDLAPHERQDILSQLVHDFNIGHIKKQQGISLSGGERRRVEIARALAAGPKFILLDEPFAGVDPISVSDIQKIIEHLVERNIGVLITDHDVKTTLSICSRAYILSEGEVIATGAPSDVANNEKVKATYLGEHFQL